MAINPANALNNLIGTLSKWQASQAAQAAQSANQPPSLNLAALGPAAAQLPANYSSSYQPGGGWSAFSAATASQNIPTAQVATPAQANQPNIPTAQVVQPGSSYQPGGGWAALSNMAPIADKLRDSLMEVIEAADRAAESQAKIEASKKRHEQAEEKAHKDFLDRFESMGKSGSELMEQFKKMREGTEQLDRKFAEITALAGSKEFRDIYGADAQKKLQQDILRQQAAEPGAAGDLARARLKKQQEDEATEGRKKAFGIGGVITGAIGSVAGGQGVAGGAAGIGGALGGFAGLGGGLATPAGAALKFGEAIFGSIDKLNKWTEGLHQANMQFAEFSGAMASVSAMAEVHKIQLDQMKGEARAGTAAKLEQSRYEKERSWAPVENAYANAKNVIGAAWNKFIGGFGQVVQTILGLDKEKDVEPITETWQRRVASEVASGRSKVWNGPRPPKGRFEEE